MASHFSANQYEKAFDSRRLQHWQLPKSYKERPDSYEGFTQIIANDRGHLMEGVPKSARSPWGEFVGTWDMPRKIPGNITTYMARSDPAVGGIKTQRIVHEQYMEHAKSPKKDLKLEPKVSSSKANMKTPPPTEIPNDEIRPNNPSPHSPTKLAESSTPEDRPGQEPMVA
ncbi:protein Flattop-like [Apostichopus japonicus]|uniref:protein Flattop-like n=1 Tax=Stichopus japonicus TaxID=307972 RepID=UPI003AB7B03A